jgi:SAM-dependent methyltransferase
MKQGAKAWDRHWEEFQDSASRNPAQAYRRRLVLGALPRGAACIADLGCGQGDLLAELGQSFPKADFIGVDGSRGALRYAAAKLPRARFALHDFESAKPLPAAVRGKADAVCCTEVLEHLDRPERCLKAAWQALKPGGRLVLTVPGGSRSAYDEHIGHRRHYTPAGLKALLEGAGFTDIRATGAGFPFFNLYRLTVILRGRKLVQDAAKADMGLAANAALRLFNLLFHFNLPSGPLGWQVFATAEKPLKEKKP